MQVKIVNVAQFEDQVQVKALRAQLKSGQEKAERLRTRMAKIRREFRDCTRANWRMVHEIEELEARIKAHPSQSEEVLDEYLAADKNRK